MKKLTQVEFGSVVGISGPAVSGLVKTGILDLANGLDKSILDYCSHLREKAAGRSGGGKYDLTEERARLSYHQANMAALDEQVKEKSLIPADVVLKRWSDIAANVRAKLLSLPSQLAVSVENLSREKIEKKSMELIKQALEELKSGAEN